MSPYLIPLFIEATARALLLAVLVWAGLRLLRVENVLAQKTAWGLVLASACLMPLLARWQLLPVPAFRLSGFQLNQQIASQPVDTPAPSIGPAQPLQAAPIAADSASVHLARITRPRQIASAPIHSLPAADRYPAPLISHSDFDGVVADSNPAIAQPQAEPLRYRLAHLQPFTVAWLLYLGVCAALLVRLAIGLGFAARLWSTAKPVGSAPQFHLPARLPLRASPRVASPVAIGSGIVLPSNFAEWETEKLRVVLAHERSHIRQGDFYLQILARLYASLFWFSPLGWWLTRKLSDLGEAISDRAGLQEAESRSSYAQVLLEFAALPRPTLIGVAMARSSSLSQRIERFLNESTFRTAFAPSRRRSLAAALLIPMALFAATTLVRVEAASQVPIAAVHQAALPVAPVRPSAVQPLPANVAAPAIQAVLPPAAISVIAHVESAVMPQTPVAPVAPIQPLPQPQAFNLIQAALVPPAPIAAPAPEPPSMAADDHPQATFDRTLTVGTEVALSVATGSGNIQLVHGSGNTVHIHGVVRADSEGTAEQVNQVVANPPIEQNGDVVRIGSREGNQEGLHHISISYEIEAPSGSRLMAATGSGNITDEGVGQQARLTTGSGNIRATGLRSGFAAQTGSGNIYVEESGEGPVKAQTGSGDIELKGLAGSLMAQTGSGDIKINGTPTADLKLQTGSGNIDLWPGNTGLTLDASFGSGGLHSDREMLTQDMTDRHHITGKLGGGGPLVRMQTGSGDIRIH